MVKKHLIKQAFITLGWVILGIFMSVSCFIGVVTRDEAPTLRRIWTGVIALLFIWFIVYQIRLYILHRKDVKAFEKDFLPETLDDILSTADKRYGYEHFLFSDRVISLEATAEFEYKDITGTAIAKRTGYRSSFKRKTLIIRLKNGVFVTLNFSAFTKACERTKAIIDERAGIPLMNIPRKGKK